MNILIVDDNPTLRNQLKRLTESVIPDCNITEAENYEDTIALINNQKFDVLVCDLFLSSNESSITHKNYIPEGVQVAKEAKNKFQPFTIIVTSNLDSFIENHQLLDYIDAGVTVFLDRSVIPYEKFSETFKYQLLIASKSLTSIQDSVASLWESQESKSYHSYWILIGDPDEDSYRNLMRDLLTWEKAIFSPEASVSLIKLDDEKLSNLINNGILNDIDDYPILLISESPEMLSNIKIGSQTLKIIQENSSLTKFLNLIHTQLRYKNLSEIQNKMESPEYWNWLNMNNIKGFSHEKGGIELVGDFRLPNLEQNNFEKDEKEKTKIKHKETIDEKPKIFRDNIGNLIIETDHKTFVAVPTKKEITVTAASAAKSISTGTAAFVAKTTTQTGSLSGAVISAVAGLFSFESLMGIDTDPRKENETVSYIVTGLSPNAFLTRITQELSNYGYTYLKLENQKTQSEKILAVYVAIPAVSIPGEEKFYRLVISKKSKKDRLDVFKKVIESFKDSKNWSLYQDIPINEEEDAYLLFPTHEQKKADKIRASNLVTKTLEKAFSGNYYD